MKIPFLFIIIAFCHVQNVSAQVSGCTDPVANNFNAAATINDGSCTYNAAIVAPLTSFNLAASLSETSGLINWNQSLWTHNDNTDINLYQLDTMNGSVIQSQILGGVVNIDWEEISQDSNFVYVGDFGNNVNGNRTNLRILRVEKNSLLSGAPVIDTIAFSYSDQTVFTPTGSNNTDFDCEAMIVSGDSIFLFTKQWIANETSVYALSKTPGTHVAQLKYSHNVAGLITGAVYMQDKRAIVLCGYSNLLQPFLYLLYDFNGIDFFSGNKRKIGLNMAFHQVEGITTNDGLKYYLSSEYFTQPPIITNPQELHILDLTIYLLPYFNLISTGITDNIVQYVTTLYPNPADDSIVIEATDYPVDFEITNSAGRWVKSGRLLHNSNVIDISAMPSGMYFVRVGDQVAERFKFLKR